MGAGLSLSIAYKVDPQFSTMTWTMTYATFIGEGQTQCSSSSLLFFFVNNTITSVDAFSGKFKLDDNRVHIVGSVGGSLLSGEFTKDKVAEEIFIVTEPNTAAFAVLHAVSKNVYTAIASFSGCLNAKNISGAGFEVFLKQRIKF